MVPFWRTRPSARAAGEAKRKRAAAPAAALEERVLRDETKEWARDASEGTVESGERAARAEGRSPERVPTRNIIR